MLKSDLIKQSLGEDFFSVRVLRVCVCVCVCEDKQTCGMRCWKQEVNK